MVEIFFVGIENFTVLIAYSNVLNISCLITLPFLHSQTKKKKKKKNAKRRIFMKFLLLKYKTSVCKGLA